MGAAASARYEPEILMELVVQQEKPIDASDIETLENAKYEIQALRRMINMIDINQLAPPSPSGGDQSLPLQDQEEPVADIARGRAIVSILAEKMEQRYTSLRDVFLKIDVDKSGYITMEEFQEKCAHWGIMLSIDDFNNLNATYKHQESCLQNDHGINYNEFINLMTHNMNYKPGEGEKDEKGAELDLILKGKIMDSFDTMKQAFQAVDKDCSGTVERGELNRVFDSFHVGHSEADIDDLFAEYDKNGDGVFSYGEFVKIMSAKKK